MNILKILAICTIGFLSCESEDAVNGELLSVSFKPTQCSELWDKEPYTSLADNSRENRIKTFLKDKGITNLIDFKKTSDSNIYCQACECPSNDNFSFKVSQSDYEKLKAIEPFKTILR